MTPAIHDTGHNTGPDDRTVLRYHGHTRAVVRTRACCAAGGRFLQSQPMP
jgi:hypothetical protein